MRTKSLLASALVAATLMLSATAQAATWTIDPAHSSVGFSIRHIFSKVPGYFDKFTGTIDYDPANPTAASVKVDIDPASIDTKTQRRDDHLVLPADELPVPIREIKLGKPKPRLVEHSSLR